MKSLHKTLDILEYVLIRNGEGVTPSEAAAATDLNLATCARIMGQLTARGYLHRLSRKEGYIAGGVIYSLSNRRNVWSRLREAAIPPINALTAELRRPVNFSVLDGSRRIMLYYHGADEQWQPWPRLFFDDFYDTATGRLLLAAADPATVEAIGKRIGPPGDLWPEVTDASSLTRELAAIRHNGHVCFRNAANGLWIVGHLLRLPGFPPAAIGFGDRIELPAEVVMAKSYRAIESIRAALTRNEPLY